MTTQPEPFDAASHLTDLKGKDYLPARQRLRWLRSEHPLWTVNTGFTLLDFEAGYAVAYAEILDETGRLIARSHKQETRQDFGDFVEKAETGAIGRVCAVAGYGTEDASELDEGTVSDSPVTRAGEAPPPRPRALAPARSSTDVPEEPEWLAEDKPQSNGKGLTFKELATLAETRGVAKNDIYKTADQLFGKGVKVTDLAGDQREQIAYEMGLLP